MSSKRSENVASWTPSEARHQFRTNNYEGSPSSGFCMGYLQANLAILPASLADEFEQFCKLNTAPCPLLYKSRPGELSAGNLAQVSDVRTDLPKYWVSENGIVTEKTGDLTSYPLDDYVSFYLGCSFSFEDALMAAGIQLQHVVKDRNVSMFTTNIPCLPVGPFYGPMVVSMRPIPKDLVEKAVIITAAYDAVHGAPIHIGDPSVIGIEDINMANFGEPSDVGDLIPMFWACGVTSSVAVRSASGIFLNKKGQIIIVILISSCPSMSTELPLSFSHQPGSMFICDITVDEYFKVNKPEHGEEQPRLITLADKPFLASVCSDSAFQKIEKLAKLQGSPTGFDRDLHVADFLKIAARLSHSPSVVIGILHEKETLSSEMPASDGLQGVLILVKALQALKKKITIVTQHHAQVIRDCVTSNAAQGISQKDVHIVELEDSNNIKERLFTGKINHRLDTMIALQATRKSSDNDDGSDRTLQGGLVDKLFKEVGNWENGIVSVKITAERQEISLADDVSSVDTHVMAANSVQMAACGVSAAFYVLNSCPIHSRYVRRGIGRREIFQVEQFFMENIKQGEACSRILDSMKDN